MEDKGLLSCVVLPQREAILWPWLSPALSQRCGQQLDCSIKSRGFSTSGSCPVPWKLRKWHLCKQVLLYKDASVPAARASRQRYFLLFFLLWEMKAAKTRCGPSACPPCMGL